MLRLATYGFSVLAGRIAAIGNDGVTFAKAGKGAVGLLTEDLGDMVNASLRASFYFRGGEYYVSTARMGANVDTIVAGDELTTDSDGKIIKLTDSANERAIGVAIGAPGEYRMGNMFEHAGTASNGGKFVGFILYM
jgi:hypothetical protein